MKNENRFITVDTKKFQVIIDLSKITFIKLTVDLCWLYMDNGETIVVPKDEYRRIKDCYFEYYDGVAA